MHVCICVHVQECVAAKDQEKAFSPITLHQITHWLVYLESQPIAEPGAYLFGFTGWPDMSRDGITMAGFYTGAQ